MPASARRHVGESGGGAVTSAAACGGGAGAAAIGSASGSSSAPSSGTTIFSTFGFAGSGAAGFSSLAFALAAGAATWTLTSPVSFVLDLRRRRGLCGLFFAAARAASTSPSRSSTFGMTGRDLEQAAAGLAGLLEHALAQGGARPPRAPPTPPAASSRLLAERGRQLGVALVSAGTSASLSSASTSSVSESAATSATPSPRPRGISPSLSSTSISNWLLPLPSASPAPSPSPSRARGPASPLGASFACGASLTASLGLRPLVRLRLGRRRRRTSRSCRPTRAPSPSLSSADSAFAVVGLPVQGARVEIGREVDLGAAEGGARRRPRPRRLPRDRRCRTTALRSSHYRHSETLRVEAGRSGGRALFRLAGALLPGLALLAGLGAAPSVSATDGSISAAAPRPMRSMASTSPIGGGPVGRATPGVERLIALPGRRARLAELLERAVVLRLMGRSAARRSRARACRSGGTRSPPRAAARSRRRALRSRTHGTVGASEGSDTATARTSPSRTRRRGRRGTRALARVPGGGIVGVSAGGRRGRRRLRRGRPRPRAPRRGPASESPAGRCVVHEADLFGRRVAESMPLPDRDVERFGGLVTRRFAHLRGVDARR